MTKIGYDRQAFIFFVIARHFWLFGFTKIGLLLIWIKIVKSTHYLGEIYVYARRVP